MALLSNKLFQIKKMLRKLDEIYIFVRSIDKK